MRRVDGQEQPYIPCGIFKIRLPGVHYKLEKAEIMQGLIIGTTSLASVPIMTEYLGLSFELAWSVAIFDTLLYLLHTLLGDPVVPGYVTSALPLVIIYLLKFPIGPERTQAMICVQVLLGLIFLIMGITKLAGFVVNRIPNAIKGGILLAAPISVIQNEFSATGRFNLYPIAIIVGVSLMALISFSGVFSALRKKVKLFDIMSKYGNLFPYLLAMFVGVAVGELGFPEFRLGTLFKLPDFSAIIAEISVFSVGMPRFSLWLEALPLAVIAYINAFGDFVTTESLVNEAKAVRHDEYVDFNSNRSNIISGIRNMIMGFLSPLACLCGPLWVGMTTSVSIRYREGRNAMDSLIGGMGSFRLATLVSAATVPVVYFMQPVFPVAASMTLMFQGLVCGGIGMEFCKNANDRYMAGIMAAVLVFKGSLWGLCTGAFLYIILGSHKKILARIKDNKEAAEVPAEIPEKITKDMVVSNIE